jgi:hypothetical protein
VSSPAQRRADVEVSTVVAASPEATWQVVADPTAMGGLTVECTEMQWTGTSRQPRVGATFRGRNRLGWRRWTTTCTIVDYEPGRRVAWDVRLGPVGVARWGYTVSPGDEPDTAVVTEDFTDHRPALVRATGRLSRGVSDTAAHNRANMTATLERVRSRAEQG